MCFIEKFIRKLLLLKYNYIRRNLKKGVVFGYYFFSRYF